MSNRPDDVALAASAISRYFFLHPQAADTAEGIASIWLQQRYPLTVVQQALRDLEREGQVKTTPLLHGGAGRLYRPPCPRGKSSRH